MKYTEEHEILYVYSGEKKKKELNLHLLYGFRNIRLKTIALRENCLRTLVYGIPIYWSIIFFNKLMYKILILLIFTIFMDEQKILYVEKRTEYTSTGLVD